MLKKLKAFLKEKHNLQNFKEHYFNHFGASISSLGRLRKANFPFYNRPFDAGFNPGHLES